MLETSDEIHIILAHKIRNVLTNYWDIKIISSFSHDDYVVLDYYTGMHGIRLVIKIDEITILVNEHMSDALHRTVGMITIPTFIKFEEIIDRIEEFLLSYRKGLLTSATKHY